MVLSQDNSIFKHKTFVELLDDKKFKFNDDQKNELKAKYLAVIGSLDKARDKLEEVKLSDSDLKKIRDYKFPNVSKSELKQLRDKINKEGKKLKKQLSSNPNVNANVYAKRNSIMNQSQQQLIQTGGDFYGVMGYLKRLLVNLLVTYIFYSLTGAAVAPLTGAFNSLIEIIESFGPEFEDFFFVPLFAIRGTQTILFSEEVSSGVTFVLNSLRQLIRLSLFPAGILTFSVGTASLVEYIQNMLGTTGQRRTFLNTLSSNIVNTIHSLTNYFTTTTPDSVDAHVEQAQSFISRLGGTVRDYARRGANIVTSIARGVWSISSFIREPVGNSLDFVITLVNNYFDSINEAYHRRDINLDILTGGAMLITLCGFTFLYGSNPSLSMITLIIGFIRFDLGDTSGILKPIVQSLRKNLDPERQLALDADMTRERVQQVLQDAPEDGARQDGDAPVPADAPVPQEQQGIIQAVMDIYGQARDDPIVQGLGTAGRFAGNIGMRGMEAAVAPLGIGMGQLTGFGTGMPIRPSPSQIAYQQGIVSAPGSDASRDVPDVFSEEAYGEGSSAGATAGATELARTGSEHSISSASTEPYPPSLDINELRGTRAGMPRPIYKPRPLKRPAGQISQQQDPPLPPGTPPPLVEIPPPPPEEGEIPRSESSRSPSRTRRRIEQSPSPSPSPSPSRTQERMDDSGSLSEEGEVGEDVDMREEQQPRGRRQQPTRRSSRRRGGARKTRKGRKAHKARKTRKSTKARKARKVNNKARKTRKSTKARKARKTRKSRK